MLNKVMLIGNVGKDPEVRHFDSGVATTTITLATSETYTDKSTGQRVTNTEWHNVVLWRQLAELAEKYIRKGSQIFIEGKIRTRSWDDKEGQKRYTTEIIADNVRLLGRRDDAGAAPVGGGYAPASPSAAPASPAKMDDPGIDNPSEADDLPF
ncbi:MAG: single-stranded DNA-binding protein [Prevotellaceae bacterium]|jgi:single-strand DNA-binding protein|nr:single-stranded DNA-binding protein [Prevotellaceae bacterium]